MYYIRRIEPRRRSCTAWMAAGARGSPVIHDLVAEREVIAVDLPGFSATPRPAKLHRDPEHRPDPQ